ncbi:MAG: hypothetical protein IIA44_10265 [Acidobacteria bacterium]|nr:hypothetical protein [Acidobacteriota bacterium]
MTSCDITGPVQKQPTDGWTPEWRRWFDARWSPPPADPGRERLIAGAVRRALRDLQYMERLVVDGYYYDGLSFGRIADRYGLTRSRVQTLHHRALTALEGALAPLVRETFGVVPVRRSACPICGTSWQRMADELLDEKTADVTWGQMAARLERAVGWRPSTPQILIAHQKHRRLFEHATEGPDPWENHLTNEEEP